METLLLLVSADLVTRACTFILLVYPQAGSRVAPWMDGQTEQVPGVNGHHGYTQGTRGVQATPRTADYYACSKDVLYTH